ncbi:hypothetical protein GCM10027275_25880 [Rhabdobacter roseus]|uniref:histidine kinase n=1 Tax=Rhabdobacter roseus TaxID=1655419 RepID=A0A840TMB2_9BACT|nr:ATP-binding protein [Rhabdobacter roseus]MBB5284534.1 signal transduction histidine kinase/HPt (histidine-containing phosphotransfer) domain-containing protein [Rhabdobacter roseus]
MSSLKETTFLQSVKGKVLLGFLISCLALAASWVVSKVAFREVLRTVEDLSSPNDRLRLINEVFKDILQLDQLQKAQTVPGKSGKNAFMRQSEALRLKLDTLRYLSGTSSFQASRIDSMKEILKTRENIFDNYLKVRSGLVSNKVLSQQVESLSGLMKANATRTDSTLIKTEKSTTTTTMFREPIAPPQEEEKRGILGRWFGSKKSRKEEETTPANAPHRLVQKQEVKVEVDTLALAEKDSIIQKVGKAIRDIETGQRQRTERFVSREQELAAVGDALIGQLLTMMQEVENEVVRQTNLDSREARSLVNQSVGRIELIMLGFFFLTALLAYLIFTDITKSNRYRRELELAKEEAEYHSLAKQRFLSNMSHEIRTPLQSIIGYTEVLKRQKQPRHEDLETLHRSSEHLLHLVNEVLDYSRIISDQFTFEQQDFLITDLLHEVMDIVRPEARRKGLMLTLEQPFEPGTYLKGDPFRLRQILHNLLSNAVKFTEVGEVKVRVSQEGTDALQEVKFEVSDTGIGLTEAQQQRIFNQFEQADASIAGRFGGTGLGLSIVKALVEGQGGTIGVESTFGEGTTFAVWLPLTPGQTPNPCAEQPQAVPSAFEGKVWLVDDDPFILQWCATVLNEYGVEHRCFASPQAMLDEPWDEEITVVFMDMRMPGMNGVELCQRLRQRAGADVRFFVVTAQALPEERETLLKAGFDGLLMKPFRTHELLALLGQTTDLPAEPNEPPLTEKVELDLSYLHAMAMGDEDLIRDTLAHFAKDTRADLERLGQLPTLDGQAESMELIHRLAGRVGQVGARPLGARLRALEVALRARSQEVSEAEYTELLREVERLVNQIEEQVPHSI